MLYTYKSNYNSDVIDVSIDVLNAECGDIGDESTCHTPYKMHSPSCAFFPVFHLYARNGSLRMEMITICLILAPDDPVLYRSSSTMASYVLHSK